MFNNFFLITLRRLWNKKSYAFLNIGGIAIAITSCLLLLNHIQKERNFDKFHQNAENIYRLNIGNFNETGRSAVSSGAMTPAFAPDFPEIEEYVRFRKFPSLVKKEDIQFYEDAFFYTDSTVFNVFDFELIAGNPRTALAEPFSLVLTQKAAKKYFGDTSPIGQQLEIDNQFTFQVTGVLKEIPDNAHFNFEYLAAVSSLRQHPDESVRYWQVNSWYSHYYHSYLLLKPETDADLLGQKIERIAAQYSNPEYYELYGQEMGLYLQPLTGIHLNPQYGELEAQGSWQNLYIFGIIALIILLIACSNYANLATALTLQRHREIGVRKVLGADKRQLSLPFFGESFLVSGLGVLLAFVFLQMGNPLWSTITGYAFELTKEMVLIALFIFFSTSILGGIYPAFIGSSFHPISIFKKAPLNIGQLSVNKGLIVFQFVLSLGLIVATLVVYEQLQFMQNQSLGMDIEQVVVLPTRGNPNVTQKFAAFENELKKSTSIHAATMSELVPGQQIFGFICRFEGQEKGENYLTNPVSYNYFKTYGMELIAGRAFSKEVSTDTLERAIINETLARELGWHDPQEAIGKRYDFANDGENIGQVIGVVKDAHFRSLHRAIPSLLFMMDDQFYRHISLSLSTQNMPQTLATIEKTWQQLFPNLPFDYFFADEHFGQQYVADQQLAALFTYFVSLAILLACLGLFGLSAFAVEQRIKEIGVRKVLGATIGNVVVLLSKDFLKLVGIAFVIAVPLTYFFMDKWLEDFAYRIDIQGWMFIVAGIAAGSIAFLTVSVQSIKAALANPINALRSE